MDLIAFVSIIGLILLFILYCIRQETNLIEAISNGATTVIKLIAYVVVNLIAFVSIIGFLDAVISYLGARVGHPEINFQVGFIYLVKLHCLIPK